MLQTLPVGDHSVTFVYTDGDASAPFVVGNPTPKTGDGANPAGWILAVLLGAAGLSGALLKGKKGKARK